MRLKSLKNSYLFLIIFVYLEMPINYQSNFVKTEHTNFSYDRNEIYKLGIL